MNQLEGLLILLALPAGLILTGYWVAGLLTAETPLERLALALPAGLVTALAAVAAINFFHPLAGLWAYACLSTALLPVLVPALRRALVRDITAAWRARQGPVLAASGLFFACLLWPVLHHPTALFYDGTSNHDSFFWISGAEHLKRNTYMDRPVLSPTQPLTNATPAIIGWKPDWGRMGAEGLLAMLSSVVGVSPLKLFLYATASLQFAWVALAWLGLRTFYGPLSARPIAAALVCLQPVFTFFFGNSNLPNLLGALAGATLVIATARALTAPAGRAPATGWLLLILLSLHGLLCAYPEMVPFVLLPAGLLWLRHWVVTGPRAAWRPAALVASAIILGFLLNAASTLRAVHGFMASLAIARADTNWANLFNPLVVAEYLPALATLSVGAARDLGPWLGWPLSLAIVVGLGCMFRFARDRFGLAAVFASTLLLIGYTLIHDFSYGWQKSVQFAGVFFGMAFPAAVLDGLNRARATGPVIWRRLTTAGLAGLAAFLVFATAMEFREGYKWSDRKVISADWFKLRELAGETLRGKTVLVEPATFRMAFFHGMWAAYFLRDSHLYYAARGEENGGYLRNGVHTELHPDMPAPAAYLVSRLWADTFDANTPRLLTGREFTLLQKRNRVLAMDGVQPLNGPPDNASGSITLEIEPHSAAHLLLTLTPRPRDSTLTGRWAVARRAAGHPDFTTELAGPPPWAVRLPLIPSVVNQLSLHFTSAGEPPGPATFQVRGLRIEDAP
ncbi:hypothetical protein Verru16b_01998 [Lacunisphaera limnophila]|uniref:Glycosyltransferase RgtA/B/C/D-like domain-containing protein n=1 Tax=Lacunisphaera limnophila TaxID=1838286 RepID=A0A1D8AVK6_9BACT|nr:hypothetical protein [Lacunisphaera limnophila]AOS44929.1 hypothetical protein Verru16b_01998 [Lacunisphaera limnophila]